MAEIEVLNKFLALGAFASARTAEYEDDGDFGMVEHLFVGRCRSVVTTRRMKFVFYLVDDGWHSAGGLRTVAPTSCRAPWTSWSPDPRRDSGFNSRLSRPFIISFNSKSSCVRHCTALLWHCSSGNQGLSDQVAVSTEPPKLKMLSLHLVLLRPP